VGLVFLFIYGFYISAGPPNVKMLKNTKYTIGTARSEYYIDKGNGRGFDIEFFKDNNAIITHQNGEFIFGRKYLVAYDSANIKNGYIVLDNTMLQILFPNMILIKKVDIISRDGH